MYRLSDPYFDNNNYIWWGIQMWHSLCNLHHPSATPFP